MYTMIPFRTHRDLNANREMQSLFDDRFLRSFFNMNDWFGSAGFRVDIRETENDYLMEAELPGVDEKDIELSVENDTITISANMNEKRKDERSCYSERRYGHVSRSFNLEGIAQDNITASYKNGVLTVTLPKEQPEPKKAQRKICINGAQNERLEADNEDKQ